MIIDKLSNIGIYKGISKNLDTAINCIMATDFHTVADGRYYLDGENVYYTVTPSYPACFEETKFETHREYADIQIPLITGEIMEFGSAEDMDGWQEYDAKNDIRFLYTDKHGVSVNLDAGVFCILFPNDAHRGRQYRADVKVGHKVIFKVKLDK